MDINGYRFEVMSNYQFKLNGHKWDKARVLVFGFEDGSFYD